MKCQILFLWGGGGVGGVGGNTSKENNSQCHLLIFLPIKEGIHKMVF